MASTELIVESSSEPLSQDPGQSQTAAEYIKSQLELEEEAREALPYAFDTCTRPLGPLRQNLFSCLTCNPPPLSPSEPYNGAGICYSCSISCHGEHTLVELFNKRNFVCDCGTTRLPSTSPCTLRLDPQSGRKGVHSETPAEGNHYDHNFYNRFCGCEIEYNAYMEKGTMFQCLGLGLPEEGGCGEDWYHPGCIVGLGRDWYEKSEQEKQDVKDAAAKVDDARKIAEHGADNQNRESGTANNIEIPIRLQANATSNENNDTNDKDDDDPLPPPGFPEEDAFDAFLCWKCVDSNPWIKRYAGTEGFLPPVYKRDADTSSATEPSTEKTELATSPLSTTPDPSTQNGLSKKRKAEEDTTLTTSTSSKKTKTSDSTPEPSSATSEPPTCRYKTLPPTPPGTLSLFLNPNFRTHFCRCVDCFPRLAKFPQLLEEEEIYEPPLSQSEAGDHNGTSVGTASLLDRGEKALSSIDRVRAIEGAMAYNQLKEKVKSFLKPFAETGQAVGAEDIKKYFEELRGDTQAVKDAAAAARANSSVGGSGSGSGAGEDGSGSDSRREQSGY